MHNLSDRALKERIIGAAVLVVFAVLVVPVFLDGPDAEQETVSEAVTLPGQNNQERKQQTIVLERDRSQPVPATRATEPEPVSPPATQQAAAEKPVASSGDPVPAAEKPAPKAAAAPTGGDSATGMFAVQLGSFADKDNAERLASDLRDQGYAAFLSQVQTDSGAMQRVRIGPQKDRESAEAIAAQLAKSGHSGQVVSHP